MITKKHVDWWNPPGGQQYSAEYQSVLDRATTLGFTLPSSDQQELQNQLVIDLKTFGIWDLLDVLYIFATDGSSNYAALNWKNPSLHQLQLINAPTFTSNRGFTGDGLSSYLTSDYQYNTGTNFTQDAASFGYHKRTTGQSLSDLSTDGAASAQVAGGTNGGNNYYRINASGPSSGGGVASVANGFRHINRSGASADQTFLNGNQIDSSTTSSTATGAGQLTILRRASGYSSGQISMAFVGGNLSSQASDFYAAWNTYKTAVGF